ncbi:MAG TPA: group 1 glycosyl transferase [Cytophagales bacterium]|nr:group 1 glycosyl transferase [Cytophagales bacterium]
MEDNRYHTSLRDGHDIKSFVHEQGTRDDPSRKSPSIAFLTPYPTNTAPGPRFRFEQYYGILQNHRIRFKVFSFFSEPDYRNVRQQAGRALLWPLLKGIVKRLRTLSELLRFDFVFIYREACPVGPPVLEWIIAQIFRKKIIYDFDDAIWLTDNRHETKIESFLRWRGKVKWICRWSHRVSCGNRYLADFASKYNRAVVVNPTTLDTNRQHHRLKPECETDKEGITIGWTGSYSTLKYLQSFVGVVQQLEQRHPHLRFLVIADRNPEFALKSFVFKKWNLETEIDDLLEMDIGVMPLPDDEWTRGKCGFKILQYMALGIPAVGSPVGVNAEIISDSNGCLATTNAEWIEALECLIFDRALRKRLGQEGQRTVIDRYSVESNTGNFLALFS